MKTSGKRTALILTPILVVSLLGGFAWSQRSGRPGGPGGPPEERMHMMRGDGGGHHGRRGGGRRFLGRMVQELGLNDEQTRAIRNILIETRKKNIKLRADARVARIELGQLITRSDADKTAVDGKVDEIARLRGDIMRQRAGAALAVREMLTPEQRVKADGMMHRLLRGRRGHRRG